MTVAPATPHPPTDATRDAWRVALRVYRRVKHSGSAEEYAHHAAVGAYLTVWPEDSLETARWEVSRAIAYASVHHAEWFRRCVR